MICLVRSERAWALADTPPRALSIVALILSGMRVQMALIALESRKVQDVVALRPGEKKVVGPTRVLVSAILQKLSLNL